MERGLLAAASAIALAAAASPACAQETGDAPPPQPAQAPVTEQPVDVALPPAEQTAAPSGAQTYTPADFTRFAPRSALDMLNQVPGFTIRAEDQQRGLGEASGNVLVNGQRLTSKADSIFDQLARIAASRVERIEIVDGSTLGIPGLSGQVANVFTKASPITGRFEYRTVHRPKYAKPLWFGGEFSVSGSTPRLEWTWSYTHGTGRGAGGGPSFIYDAAGNLIENRQVLLQFVGDFPRVAGRVKWDGPGSMVVNLNASYSLTFADDSNDEQRDLLTGVDRLRDFDNQGRSKGYEIGGDVDFALGSGRMKLIALDRFTHGRSQSDSIFIYADNSPDTGSRFLNVADAKELVGRAEYRWQMLGGGWQFDAEAAYNSRDQEAHFYNLDPAGEFIDIPFPGSSGKVSEDRYEAILTHNRTLAKGLTMQLGAGGEYSKISQTGPGGLTREFWRPKGSLTLAWTPQAGLDLSLKIARTVGQLAFETFLANANLAQNTQNAGNVELVPPQAWEADLELKKTIPLWGSLNVRAYGRWIEDFIDIIPIGNAESQGNVDHARIYGLAVNITINLDPLGIKGAKINANGTYEDSRLDDPLTGIPRPMGNAYWRGEIGGRYDIPESDWALGGGMQWTYVNPYVRLFEVGRNFEGPIYTYAFIENKDVFGLTVNLNVFNLTGGKAIFDRTVWTGLRDRTPIAFFERRALSVQPIFRIQVKGSF